MSDLVMSSEEEIEKKKQFKPFPSELLAQEEVAKQTGKDIIKQDKEAVKTLVDGNEQLAPQEKEQVKKNVEVIAKDETVADQPGSVSSQFTDALTFFLPQIIGGLGGALVEGTQGALMGAQAGAQAGQAYRAHQLQQEEMALKRAAEERKAQPDALELERIKQAGQRIDLQLEDLKLQKERNKALEFDRDFRREERDLERSIKAKQAFSSRADVKKMKESLAILDEMEDIVTKAPEIAVGTIPAKIARGVAGEVGVLTNEDIKRANISPSFYRNLKRKGAQFLSGKLPKEDVAELKKVIKAMREAKKNKFRGKVDAFSKSRSKNFSDKIKQDFYQDLIVEHELEKEAPRKRLMNDAQRKRLQELKAKYRK